MIARAADPGLTDCPVAILAGGLAKRLRPVTETIPKALVTVAGLPFLSHQLRLLHSAGLRRIVLCVGYLGETIEEQFDDGTRFGLKISYSYDQPTLLGTGGALKRALPLLGQCFFVLYGDSYLRVDYGEVLRAFIASKKMGLMTVFQNEGRWDTSNVRFEAGQVLLYDKKQPTKEMRHIDYGLGMLRPEALARWPENEPFDLAEVYGYLVSESQLAGYEIMERFYEIGSPKGLVELDALLRQEQRTTG